MVVIPLHPAGFALVDQRDIDLVSGLKWYAVAPDKSRPCALYAMAKPYDPETKRQPTVWMHRVIVNCPRGFQVDHIDHDGLNNTRSNLRICTQSLNNANSRSTRGVSGFRGVYPRRRKFCASISIGGRMHHLGRYSTPEEAAAVYDREAKRAFGEFATLNFPGVA